MILLHTEACAEWPNNKCKLLAYLCRYLIQLKLSDFYPTLTTNVRFWPTYRYPIFAVCDCYFFRRNLSRVSILTGQFITSYMVGGWSKLQTMKQES